ncbi:ADP-ribose pyrophosphatase YjhB (NUDIX family) [Tamilnaduibacter salinus]|uniref:ADP-ribose pyrophosphatase YjhB (NUDIX family) n=1 Tax=Tamilnaduibacter salinus TaxID=1484056 RepID=A0A2A2I4M2_9GAMM|nr:CoA pyrophosphatase [Tamilnaduibacter salinus]PAV26542.1 coenzyme A pyrophosphatase [Tamilnaduibacter salinus]PVY75894.1 ADP-ribose pyrophosphatase YjhB (NUDIX family) [Tamilnaduibacter salinus]
MPTLHTLRPQKIPLRRYLARASVALIHRTNSSGEQELLFIQRAVRDGDPWSGDMAFPGGRMEAQDRNPQRTAERETLEETGLDLASHGELEGRLAELVTREHSRWRPMVVTPYVYRWRGPEDSMQNHEVDRMVWIPHTDLVRSVRLWRTSLGTLRVPCYRYDGHCIWGLSYSMLRDFQRRA